MLGRHAPLRTVSPTFIWGLNTGDEQGMSQGTFLRTPIARSWLRSRHADCLSCSPPDLSTRLSHSSLIAPHPELVPASMARGFSLAGLCLVLAALARAAEANEVRMARPGPNLRRQRAAEAPRKAAGCRRHRPHRRRPLAAAARVPTSASAPLPCASAGHRNASPQPAAAPLRHRSSKQRWPQPARRIPAQLARRIPVQLPGLPAGKPSPAGQPAGQPACFATPLPPLPSQPTPFTSCNKCYRCGQGCPCRRGWS